jgi:hypothetical protein
MVRQAHHKSFDGGRGEVSPIRFPPMSNPINEDTAGLIVDRIKHPVVADPESVVLLSSQLLTAGGAWIIIECQDLLANSPVDLRWQAVHFTLG